MSFNISALNTFRNVNLGGDNAIANLDGEGGIKKNKELGNFIGRMFRLPSTKANNNAVRAELLRSLGQAFGLGGVSKRDGKLHFSADFMARLESILGRDVLKTGDFEIGADGSVTSGKPLTQRRITAIVNKAVQKGKSKSSQTNNSIARAVESGEIDGLPQDIKDAISAMKDAINARCGAGTVDSLDAVLSLIGKYPLVLELNSVAKDLMRDLNGQDMTEAMNSALAKGPPVLEQAKLLERLVEIAKDVKGAKVDKPLATAMFKAVPDLLDELKNCQTPEAFKLTLDKFEQQIKERMEINAMMNECETKAFDILSEEFKKMTGLDLNTLKPAINKQTFGSREFNDLKTDINSGKVVVKTAADVKNAYVKRAQDFVTLRQALATQVEDQFKELLPDWALQHLRECALTAPKIDEFILDGAKYLNEIDLKPLKAAVSAQPFNLQYVSSCMLDVVSKIFDIGNTVIGAEKMFDLGLEGKEQFAKIMLKATLANDAELVKTINSHAEEIAAAIHRFIENNSEDKRANQGFIAISINLPNAMSELVGAMSAPAPEIKGTQVSSKEMPKITNQEEFEDFFFSLDTNTQSGSLVEDGKMPDALGNERETFVFHGIVFRSDDRKISFPTMENGFTSRNDLSKIENKIEAMGLGVKGQDEQGKDIIVGPGATGQSGVSCAKTIGGAITYLDENKTFYIIDTTKIPKNEKAWDMENTILKNKFKETDESNGEVNVSYIPRNAIIGWVNIPRGTLGRAIANTPDTDEKLKKLNNIARGTFGPYLKLTFNPEYKA